MRLNPSIWLGLGKRFPERKGGLATEYVEVNYVQTASLLVGKQFPERMDVVACVEIEAATFAIDVLAWGNSFPDARTMD
jgi:hypothetical protein